MDNETSENFGTPGMVGDNPIFTPAKNLEILPLSQASEVERKIGRPTLKTPLRMDKICEALRKSAGRMAAAEAVGVSWTAVRNWIEEDPEFAERVATAEAECELELVSSVWKSAVGEGGVPRDARMALELLKRRFRTRGWGDMTAFDIRRMPSDQLLAILHEYDEAEGIAGDSLPALEAMIESGADVL